MSKQAAETYLRTYINPGDTVYTVLRSVSRSGLSRTISTHIMRSDDITGKPVITDCSWAVAKLLGLKMDPKTGGVKVAGLGEDMGYHLVYRLSTTLGYGFDGIRQDWI
jgi:hypothetical protein